MGGAIVKNKSGVDSRKKNYDISVIQIMEARAYTSCSMFNFEKFDKS